MAAPLKKYVIERNITGIGASTPEELKAASQTSNKALAEIGSDSVQWVESFVVADKTYCIYLAKDEATVQKHAEISGFPANSIQEVKAQIDPTTGA